MILVSRVQRRYFFSGEETMKSVWKAVGALSCAALLLTGCQADVTSDVVIKEHPEDSNVLVADMTQKVSLEVSEEAGGAEQQMELDCGEIFSPAELDDEGIDYEIEEKATSTRQTCEITYEELSLDELSAVVSDGDHQDVEVSHDINTGEVRVYMAGEEEGSTSEMEQMQQYYGIDYEMIFEFPGDVVDHQGGALIAEREYDGSIDRSRLANQDVEEASIVHLEDEEVFSGFEIIAEDGISTPVWTYVVYVLAGLLGLGLMFGLGFLLWKLSSRKTTVSFQDHHKDRHDITLENPNGTGNSTYPHDD